MSMEETVRLLLPYDGKNVISISLSDKRYTLRKVGWGTTTTFDNMKVGVLTEGEDIINVDVTPDMELQNFKALLEFETGIPSQDIALYCNGSMLTDSSATLDGLGVKGDDVILLTRNSTIQGARGASQQQSTNRTNPPSTREAPPSTRQQQQQQPGISIDWSSVQIPVSGSVGSRPSSSRSRPAQAQPPASRQDPEDPAVIRQMFLADPHQMALLKERNPRLANALTSGSLEEFTKVLTEQRNERLQRERERIRMLAADPFDPNIQSRIAEEIRMENINANMETAMEYSPESFGQVFMLYINCKVNGHPVKAFVDSGAQMTIMSARCAERCHITHLIDQRFSGTAVGVGTQKIIGRVHMCQIQIENDFLPSSFSVLEEQPMDMLLGLDVLKRHQCCIDLRENVLKIGTTGSQTSFLPEADLPECARLNQRGFENVPSPGRSTQEEEDRMLAEVIAKSTEDSNPSKQT